MTEELAKKIKETMYPLEGWCSPEKALKLSEYITEKYFELNNDYPRLVVELGVFGGKSLIPMALALRHNWDTKNIRGVIDGIDMWCKEAAHEGDIGSANAKYWEDVDYNYVFKLLDDCIKKEMLEPYVNLFKGKSYELANLFEKNTIDILHQDSSHSTETSLKEIEAYFPKLKSGCLWIMDDLDWVNDEHKYTLEPAFKKLLELGFKEIDDFEPTPMQSHWKILRR